MVRGSFQLDLKRDDPRTLMIKIDRRSTFGGRERQHAYRLEAEREIRHINYAKQLSVAAFNRSHREMSKRNEFLKGLVESNQERRRLLEADLIQRGELIPKRRRSRKKNRNLPELPRKKLKPELHNASVVGSVRRDTMEYVGSRKQSDFLLRSLNEMNASEKKHLANQKQMMDLEEAKQDIMNGKIVDNVTAMEPIVTDSAGKSGKDFVAGKATVATRTLSLPQLSDLERRKAPVPVKPGLQKRMSLSNMISSGGISELQGQSGSSFGGEKPGLARSFYLNTSTLLKHLGHIHDPNAGSMVF
ncbi:hypothetical protein BSL78_19056 [Apostichopus japonicus]|uniref:Uncharacterized protein n=1 Tax=Stichopus japonicus TaxID=307972 RepID=A0A2G8K7U3_STIJA|nr:hypothetical protein BSL78_19056 [Apostichopus japonicus]